MKKIIFIEGGAAAGKTTFAAKLGKRLCAELFHIDDFFLPPEKKTKERLLESGGNFDRERFLAEVLLPLAAGKPFSYCKYDCKSGGMSPEIAAGESDVAIIEGVYSMHPELRKYGNFGIFLEISPGEQEERLKQRQNYADFVNIYLPLEQKYFESGEIKAACRLIGKADDSDFLERCATAIENL